MDVLKQLVKWTDIKANGMVELGSQVNRVIFSQLTSDI